MPRIRVVAAQLNLVVGDLDGNAARILDAYDRAAAVDADLAAFPELAVTGYPPEDLLLRPAFVADARTTLDKIAARTGPTAAVIGFPERLADGNLANSAALCHEGVVKGVYRKHHLPNYAVFDEERYFEPYEHDGPLFTIAGLQVALTVCEDAWSAAGPIVTQAAAGAELVVNINASPYYAGRVREREEMLRRRVQEAEAPIVYVNLVGGQDELVFDGASMVVAADGSVVARARQFEEDQLVADLDVRRAHHRRPRADREAVTPLETIAIGPSHLGLPGPPPRIEPLLEPVHEVYRALVVGTRDYMVKNGFTHVLLGLSGGIDSSLVAAIAADALGPEQVTGVLMPSRFSSEGSVTDAAVLARNLGINTITIPIEPAHSAFAEMLADAFAGTEPGLAEENLQARIRGTVLMAISNKFGWLVLTTGNKSEMATGYSTLYGDMAGGFAVIKDVPKMLVYAICEDINRRLGREVVPRTVIEKAPSAELRPDQKDEDSLPPYALLDRILEGYVEEDRSIADLVGEGYDRDTVTRVARLVDRAEYKRRQAPPGVRVSPKAFGKDRRLPLTNRWSG
jgi:NAD+ synthase (glutamine-hydrolysing)